MGDISLLESILSFRIWRKGDKWVLVPCMNTAKADCHI